MTPRCSSNQPIFLVCHGARTYLLTYVQCRFVAQSPRIRTRVRVASNEAHRSTGRGMNSDGTLYARHSVGCARRRDSLVEVQPLLQYGVIKKADGWVDRRRPERQVSQRAPKDADRSRARDTTRPACGRVYFSICGRRPCYRSKQCPGYA